MFDFPSYRPNGGDHKRFNEKFCKSAVMGHCPASRIWLTLPETDINMANTLIDEFPCRPHWTKNTREVFTRSAKNLDPGVCVSFSFCYFPPQPLAVMLMQWLDHVCVASRQVQSCPPAI